jgi:hypothetical protein
MDPIDRAGIADRLAAETLLEQLPDWRGLGPQEVTRALEGRAPPALRRLAAELAELRGRARNRLAQGDRLLLTRKGLEQATGDGVCAWRRGELSRLAPGAPLADLTCGLGLESQALAPDRPVVAVDSDPLHAGLARLNLERLSPGRARVVIGDGARPPVRVPLVLADPDRRASGARELDPGRWSPSFAALATALAQVRGGCLKLAPAAEVEALDAALPAGLPRRWVWVGRGRELAELTLFTGQLADPGSAPFRALRLGPEGEVQWSYGGDHRRPLPSLTAAAASGVPWVAEPHPALVRSGLLGALARELGLAPLGPRLAFLGGESPPEHGGLRRYRVLGSCAADRRRVRALLGRHGIGPVDVAVRGHPESAERLARTFHGPGERRGRLLVARLERGHQAYLVEEA